MRIWRANLLKNIIPIRIENNYSHPKNDSFFIIVEMAQQKLLQRRPVIFTKKALLYLRFLFVPHYRKLFYFPRLFKFSFKFSFFNFSQWKIKI